MPRYQDVVISTRPLVYLPLGEREGLGAGQTQTHRQFGTLSTQGTSNGDSITAAGSLGWNMGGSTNFPSPGQNSDKVEVVHDDSMNVSTFTVGTWLRRGAISSQQIATRDRVTGDPGDEFWNLVFTTGEIARFQRVAGGAAMSNVDSTLTITDTTKSHHVVCVVDGTSVNHYFDGVNAGSGTLDDVVATTGSCSFAAGGLAGSNNANHFRGDLGHVAYWTRALSVAEITRLYTAGRNGETWKKF